MLALHLKSKTINVSITAKKLHSISQGNTARVILSESDIKYVLRFPMI